jgi:hypothetical protein
MCTVQLKGARGLAFEHILLYRFEYLFAGQPLCV